MQQFFEHHPIITACAYGCLVADILAIAAFAVLFFLLKDCPLINDDEE